MPDFLSMVERSLKAVRYGFFCVNDQLALALDGFCHTPAMDYVDHTEHLDPDHEPVCPRGIYCICDKDSAVSPQAAEGPSDSDSANLSAPSPRGTPNPAGTAIVRGDGLREAILAADPHTLRVSAVVGDRCFMLNSWTLRSICSEQVFETSWYEFKPEQHIFEK